MKTREQIDDTQEQVLTAYEDWVERSKAKGDFSADMSSQFAATYIDPKKRSCHLLQRPKALHLKDFLNILASPVE